MVKTLTDKLPLCPDSVHGPAMCSYCETAIKNNEGALDDSRRRAILDALSSIDLGLTEKEQRAMGRCLAYFDHFSGTENGTHKEN